MATKDSIMKQSIFFWVFGHRLSFEYGLKKFLFGAWRNLSGALRELILNAFTTSRNKSYSLFYKNILKSGLLHVKVWIPRDWKGCWGTCNGGNYY